jgi:hypothetical protein
MEEAEHIARDEHGSIKLAVISGELTSLQPLLIYNPDVIRRCRHTGLLSQAGI